MVDSEINSAHNYNYNTNNDPTVSKNALDEIKQENFGIYKLIKALPPKPTKLTPRQKTRKFSLTDCSPIIQETLGLPI